MLSWFKKLFKKEQKIQIPPPEVVDFLEDIEAAQQTSYLLFTAITLKHKGELFVEQEFIEAAQNGYKLNMDDVNNGVHLCVYKEDGDENTNE